MVFADHITNPGHAGNQRTIVNTSTTASIALGHTGPLSAMRSLFVANRGGDKMKANEIKPGGQTMATTNRVVEKQDISDELRRLLEHGGRFRLPTPLKHDAFEFYLNKYGYDRQTTKYIVDGLSGGFDIEH